MAELTFSSADDIRQSFSTAMSQMYRDEVPQYGALLDIVADVNAVVLQEDEDLRRQFFGKGEEGRLDGERHGAIRLGTSQELSTVRRAFRILGMHPVGYYDLSVAGVPVHSTAFRPISDASLLRNPFRIFTSLLRLELIEDLSLREEAAKVLSSRQIFTARAIELVETFERRGGLRPVEADEFVKELLETFRWHSDSTVSEETYQRLLNAHRLVADVVCFRGPHINHLTPRTLDIDEAQREMLRRGLEAKKDIEGPPRRKYPILLRQTSFKALDENIFFSGNAQGSASTHTARFGEIEQRGLALTPKGRSLYDLLLANARNESSEKSDVAYEQRLSDAFSQFPDDLEILRKEGLGYFRYSLTQKASKHEQLNGKEDLESLVKLEYVRAVPIVYEDFLPVSAAGIFQSNLAGLERRSYVSNEDKETFEKSLGAKVLDEFELYDLAEQRSIQLIKTWQIGLASEASRTELA